MTVRPAIVIATLVLAIVEIRLPHSCSPDPRKGRISPLLDLFATPLFSIIEVYGTEAKIEYYNYKHEAEPDY